VPFVIGARTSLLVAMDWTDFDADHQASIMLSLITEHGRATPLVWLTVNKAGLKHRRSLYERRVLVRLAEIVPAGVGVCIVADRGFGDQTLYQLLAEELHFDYVIRFRGNIKVTAASGVASVLRWRIGMSAYAYQRGFSLVQAVLASDGAEDCRGRRPRVPTQSRQNGSKW
jgi:hypothetical protein